MGAFGSRNIKQVLEADIFFASVIFPKGFQPGASLRRLSVFGIEQMNGLGFNDVVKDPLSPAGQIVNYFLAFRGKRRFIKVHTRLGAVKQSVFDLRPLFDGKLIDTIKTGQNVSQILVVTFSRQLAQHCKVAGFRLPLSNGKDRRKESAGTLVNNGTGQAT